MEASSAEPRRELGARPSRWPAFIASLVLLAGLAVFAIHRSAPPFPQELSLTISLPKRNTGSEPLIATGRRGAGDLLYLRYNDSSASIGYDSWGRSSPPIGKRFEIPADRRLHLVVEMPAVYAPRGHYGQGDPLLRVTCNGQIVLEGNIGYYARADRSIWFGQNAIGSGSADTVFSGEIVDARGNRLQGSPSDYLSCVARLRLWVANQLGSGAFLLVVAAIVFGTWPRIATAVIACIAAVRRSWTVALAISASATVFATLMTLGTWDFARLDFFTWFYDFQARSLLAGRIDVPFQGIGGEAFEFGGKYFGYFGITPALLRLPLMLFDPAPGSLAIGLMVAEYVGLLAASLWLIREVSQLAGASSPVRATHRVVFLHAIGLGSPVLFLGTRAMYFHEAILCGLGFSLAACALGLNYLRRPRAAAAIGALGLCVLAANARPTTGLFAVVFLAGCFAASSTSFARKALLIAACASAFCTTNLVGYWRFRTFDASPLEYSVAYRGRRLDEIRGAKFYVRNLPFGAFTYLVRSNLQLVHQRPFVHVNSNSPSELFPSARVDVVDRTVALPFCALCLVVLAAAGVPSSLRDPRTRVPMVITLVAAGPLYASILAYVGIAHRYTADLCAPLVLAAAFTCVRYGSVRLQPVVRWFVPTVLAVSIVVSIAIAIDYQTTWGPNFSETEQAEYRRFLGIPPAAQPPT
jgi:hypothetical protein